MIAGRRFCLNALRFHSIKWKTNIANKTIASCAAVLFVHFRAHVGGCLGGRGGRNIYCSINTRVRHGGNGKRNTTANCSPLRQILHTLRPNNKRYSRKHMRVCFTLSVCVCASICSIFRPFAARSIHMLVLCARATSANHNIYAHAHFGWK